MPLTELALTTITTKVFNYAIDHGQSIIREWISKKWDLDPKRQAFKHALSKAYHKFESQHPQQVADLFDISFLENEGIAILAKFLLREGRPNPSDLAASWANSLNIHDPRRRTKHIRELEPAAADFLDYLTSALKEEQALEDLNNSRVFEQIANDLKAIREKLQAEEATPGTYWDYLRWLMERNLYLDSHGTLQTYRQVQVKLDEIYISLRAELEEMPGSVDRKIFQKELVELEEKLAISNLTPEEVEDQREQLIARFGHSQTTYKAVHTKTLELTEAVNSYDHLVILGDPGSGKTTLLRYLALKHAQALVDGRKEPTSHLGKALFPIFVRIAEYTEYGMAKGKSLSDFLPDYCCMHECSSIGLSDLLLSKLAEGNCLVLLDGLDEIVSVAERGNVVQQIEDFVRRHSIDSNHFVITSRMAGYRNAQLSERFVHYLIQEMDEKQIRRLLERWCLAVEVAQTPQLSSEAQQTTAQREVNAIMKVVLNSSGVYRLAANPLLLRILALIHRTGAQLPQERIELYRLAADTLARTWRSAQGITIPTLVTDEYLTPLLSKMAYWLHAHKDTGIATEREVYEVLSQEWAYLNDLPWDPNKPNAKIQEAISHFLTAVREHTGLFVERAPKRYGFMHLTFEEYFAARYLISLSKTRAALIRSHLHDSRWNEPILLALGFVGLESRIEAQKLLETAILAQGEDAQAYSLTPSLYEDLLGRDYLFALQCLGDAIPIRPKLIQKMLKRAADELLYHQGLGRFEQYRQTLRERLSYLEGIEEYRDLILFLVKALEANDNLVGSNAVESLQQFANNPQVLKALLKTLNSENKSDVRQVLIRSLMLLENPSQKVIITILRTIRESGMDPGLDWYYFKLKRMSPQILDELLLIVLHHPNPNVRSEAARLLGYRLRKSSRKDKIGEKLIKALQEKDSKVRFEAAYVLGCMGHASKEVVRALITTLQDPVVSVRARALASLGMLDEADSQNEVNELTKAIIDMLNSPERTMQQTAWWCLGRLTHYSSILEKFLLNDLQIYIMDTKIDLRYLANIIRKIPKRIFPLIMNSLHEEIKSKKPFRAAILLSQLTSPSMEVSSILTTALKRRIDPRIRFEAALQLGYMGQLSTEVIMTLLTSANRHIDSNSRYAADDFLERLEDLPPQILTELFSVLQNDSNPEVRFKVAVLLGKVGQRSNEVTTTLIEGLHSANNYFLRQDVALCLGLISQGDKSTIEALRLGLLDEYSVVRKACAESFARLGKYFASISKDVEATLVQAIGDPEFTKTDSDRKRAAYEYAYDGLWSLVVGGQFKEDEVLL